MVLDWVSVPAYDTFLRVVTRTINRYLIGFPLCEYLVHELFFHIQDSQAVNLVTLLLPNNSGSMWLQPSRSLLSSLTFLSRKHAISVPLVRWFKRLAAL